MGGIKPTASFVLSLVGGIIIFIIGLLRIFRAEVGMIELHRAFEVFAGLAAFGTACGIIVVIGALMVYVKPEQHTIWGIIIIIFSVFSFIGAAAGLLVGFILGLIGGIMALMYTPKTDPS
jgi:hypothetical protein